MQPQNHGSSLKQIVNRNCKVLSPNQEKPCNLKPAQNRKIDSRSAAYAFFTSDILVLPVTADFNFVAERAQTGCIVDMRFPGVEGGQRLAGCATAVY